MLTTSFPILIPKLFQASTLSRAKCPQASLQGQQRTWREDHPWQPETPAKWCRRVRWMGWYPEWNGLNSDRWGAWIQPPDPNDSLDSDGWMDGWCMGGWIKTQRSKQHRKSQDSARAQPWPRAPQPRSLMPHQKKNRMFGLAVGNNNYMHALLNKKKILLLLLILLYMCDVNIRWLICYWHATDYTYTWKPGHGKPDWAPLCITIPIPFHSCQSWYCDILSVPHGTIKVSASVTYQLQKTLSCGAGMPGMSKTWEGSPPDPWIWSTSLAGRIAGPKHLTQQRLALGCFNPSNLIAARLSSMGKAYNSWGALKACSAWNSLGGGGSMASKKHDFRGGCYGALHFQKSQNSHEKQPFSWHKNYASWVFEKRIWD